MADVVAHDALLWVRRVRARKQESSSRKVPQGGTSGAGAYLPKRYKHRDVRSRSLSRHPKSTRCGRPRRIGRRGERNDTMILPAYRHGLRVAALMHLRWDQVDLAQGLLHVRRVKSGVPSTHPLTGTAMRALRKLKPLAGDAAYVFLSERQGPLTDSSMRKMIARAGELLGWDSPCTLHQLRHGCGYKLANDQQDTRAIPTLPGASPHPAHGHIYLELAAAQLKDFRRDECEQRQVAYSLSLTSLGEA